jgi:hypothetical protein
MSLSHLKHKAIPVFQKFRIIDSFNKYFSFMGMSEELFYLRKVRILRSWHFIKTFKGYQIVCHKILNRGRLARRSLWTSSVD